MTPKDELILINLTSLVLKLSMELTKNNIISIESIDDEVRSLTSSVRDRGIELLEKIPSKGSVA
jgi:hypothetical protein